MKIESAFKLKKFSEKCSKDFYVLAKVKLIEYVGNYIDKRTNETLLNSLKYDHWDYSLITDIRISLKINLRKIFISEEE